LSGPAKLPPAILNRMNEEVNKAMSSPEVAARMRRDGMITNPMSPEQFQQFIANEKKVWSPVVRQVGLAAEKN
jgi:tripartite-type tricarboxylate transporter receptor subunit TctC